MSLQRLTAPLVPLLRRLPNTFIRRPASSQLCRQCFRPCCVQQNPEPLFRRRFATAVAHQPQGFETEPPPRNAGIPETSIAGGRPSTDKPPYTRALPATSPESEHQASARVTEAEAQIPKPPERTSTVTPVGLATPAAATPSVAAESRPRRSKLRARKAAMTLSQAAVTQLRELLNQPDPKLIRVGVKNRGCSGLAYHLEYVDKAGAFDEAVDQDGVQVLVDSKALFSIIGSEMDWVEDKLSRRFVFKNPNISVSISGMLGVLILTLWQLSNAVVVNLLA